MKLKSVREPEAEVMSAADVQDNAQQITGMLQRWNMQINRAEIRDLKVQLLGRYIVADPGICHGKPTFRGTRVLVSDVLEQVASGMAWETIIEEWNDSITREAIREAVQLASQALLRHTDEFTLASVAA